MMVEKSVKVIAHQPDMSNFTIAMILKTCQPKLLRKVWSGVSGFQTILGQKKTPSKRKQAVHGGVHQLSCWWWEAQNRRIMVQAGLGKKQDCIYKITIVKVVEHLLMKSETWSSNSSTAENKTNKINWN
jgi:hypothetical protein